MCSLPVGTTLRHTHSDRGGGYTCVCAYTYTHAHTFTFTTTGLFKTQDKVIIYKVYMKTQWLKKNQDIAQEEDGREAPALPTINSNTAGIVD